jgi:hypothetical protein
MAPMFLSVEQNGNSWRAKSKLTRKEASLKYTDQDTTDNKASKALCQPLTDRDNACGLVQQSWM